MKKTIRERTLEYEKMMLCEYACPSCASVVAGRRRDTFEADCEIRTDFQRDRDRIIHSGAFR
ncbi:MAG: deoxyguanosinetriphosphate triphosphohydrolase, partial [Oscillospiraceae bacterium]|nr:deoxyguanosinetriphosphate triphosphohydrolase [Oscillospiraceae bacterium]